MNKVLTKSCFLCIIPWPGQFPSWHRSTQLIDTRMDTFYRCLIYTPSLTQKSKNLRVKAARMWPHLTWHATVIHACNLVVLTFKILARPSSCVHSASIRICIRVSFLTDTSNMFSCYLSSHDLLYPYVTNSWCHHQRPVYPLKPKRAAGLGCSYINL